MIPLLHYLKYKEYMNEMLQSYYMHMEQLEVFRQLPKDFIFKKTPFVHKMQRIIL